MRNPKILVLDQDEALADQVRRACEELRPRPEVVACEVTGAVAELVDDEGPFDVVVAGPGTATKRGVARLQALRRQMPTAGILLAFSERPLVSLRDLIRAGAVDLLVLPVEVEALTAAIERALEIAPTDLDQDRVQGPRSECGTLYSVGSASGGAGKTFYATNLAYFLHRQTNSPVCIVDLDLQFGEVAIALRLRPRYTIADILDRNDEDDAELEGYLDEYVVVHDTGVHVLAAPKDPVEAERVEAAHVVRILEAVRRRFEYVVVDTPPGLTELVLSSLEVSDEVHVLATLDVPSLRNMNLFLKTLDQLNISQDRLRLVLNKAERDLGVDVNHVAKLLPNGLFVELPYVREVTKSFNLGTPVLALSPGSAISRALENAWRSLLPHSASANGHRESTPDPGLFSRVFRRAAPVGSNA